jgi:DNA-binding CsgD family transcriptional regulator
MKPKTAFSYNNYLQQRPASPGADINDVGYYLHHYLLPDNFATNGMPVVFLFDYSQRSYPHITDNVTQEIGHAAGAFQEGGSKFFRHICHPDDFKVFNEKIFGTNISFLKGQEATTHPQYRLSITLRMQCKNGTYDTFLLQNSFIYTDQQGNPVLSFGTVANITPYISETKVMHRIDHIDKSGKCQNIISNSYFPNLEQGMLSKRESEVLKWILEGLTSQAIADKLFITLHTVKSHRKNMLEKTNAKNMADLIHYAITEGLI